MNRFKQSARALRQARRYLAGGVSSSLRAASQPTPLFFRSARGATLTDFDGTRYIDFSRAWGPLILGHSHPAVVRGVRRQLDRFQLLGAQHELEQRVAAKICRIVPCVGLVAFSNSGTEAVQVALRLARAYTDRQKFVKFEGHYHGWCDSVLLSYHPDASCPANRPIPASAGQSPAVLADACVLDWNNVAALESLLEEHHREIAAIITEPILCNSGCLMPVDGYLARVPDASMTSSGLVARTPCLWKGQRLPGRSAVVFRPL